MKKKKLRMPWKDCLTLLSWEQVRLYETTQKEFTLEMVCHDGATELFTGKMVCLHPLSENAFYFWFQGFYKNQLFAIKVKQNMEDRMQRYLDKISVDSVQAYYARMEMSS